MADVVAVVVAAAAAAAVVDRLQEDQVPEWNAGPAVGLALSTAVWPKRSESQTVGQRSCWQADWLEPPGLLRFALACSESSGEPIAACGWFALYWAAVAAPGRRH